jgi:hypothetical protein
MIPANCPFGAKHLGANKMIRLLVNFLTLEASSLGATAVSSIRVVEIRPAVETQRGKDERWVNSMIRGTLNG